MKHCVQCGRTFPDSNQFCQYDRTPLRLVETQGAPPLPGSGSLAVRTTLTTMQPRMCQSCGTELSANAQFCRSCGTAATANVSHAPATVLGENSEFREQQARKRRVAIVVGVVAVLLAGGLYYKSLPNPIEGKLTEAIEKRNLLTPAGANAYEFYHQLKVEGIDEKKLKAFDEKLLPLVTAQPRQMLIDFAAAGSKDPSPAEWEQAAKLLRWALEMKPDDPELLAKADYCTGRVAYLANRKDEALELWKRSGDTYREWALASNGVGLIYNERKDYATARTYLFEAINRDANWAVPYNNVGTSFFYERNYDQAEYYYQQAVERASNWARPHAWLGAIAMQQKDYWRAIIELELVLDPSTFGKENIDLNRIRQQLDDARRLSMENTFVQ